jgi:hypothetical protein
MHPSLERTTSPPTRAPCRHDTPFRTPYCRAPPPPRRTRPINSNEFTPAQSKLPPFKGLMYPRNEVLNHPAGPDLLQYALEGCPVDCGDDWTLEQLEAAIRNGAHASANVPEAAAACKKEALERVNEGSCRLVNWDDIKDDFPSNLKISPLAAVPHKSRIYRMILDLSFQLLVNGKRLESVNSASDKSLAKQEAMYELGNVIPRIIWAMALSKDTVTPFMFTKVDLKDGYWRMAVNEADAWNFAYVLPGAGPDDPIQLVIPDALQMGWSESPPFFCAATETARDIIDEKMRNETPLPEQPMENIMMDIDWSTIEQPHKQLSTEKDKRDFLQLIEVYIDDFIGVIQSTNETHLRQFSRQILDGITKVFPPPELSGSKMSHPVSEKKLIEDGIWNTRKEILGWLFDGMARTIELPQRKCEELLIELKAVRRLPKLEVKRFQKLHGRLQFATIAIPCGKPILGQLNWYMSSASKNKGRKLLVTRALQSIFRDWSALIRLVGRRPTHVTELIEHPPSYQGFVDASKWGVGGVWFSGTQLVVPIVWFYEWPQEIRAQFCSASNKTGSLTISDLELTGILLHWLVLEHVVNPITLRDSSVSIWCDNLPAVAWMYKFRTSTSLVAARVLRALAVRLHTNRAALLSVEHISGVYNKMADVASRKHSIDNTVFLTEFSALFPPPQGESWTMFLPSNKITSKVSSELLEKQSTLESWRRLPTKGYVFGKLGHISSPSIFHSMTQNLVHSHNQNESMCWSVLPNMCDPEAFHDDNNKFVRKQSKYRCGPSQRALNWTENKVRWLIRKENTIRKSANFLKATAATTLPPSFN